MKPTHTPGKRLFSLPTPALGQAIEAEWAAHKKYSPAAMPLTALAYTAIDRIEGNEAAIVEALLVYIDTDTLSYRADPSQAKLLSRQQAQWDPLLAWLQSRFDVHMHTTTGIMPAPQPEALHRVLSRGLGALDAMRLSAACILASGCSSLLLTLAVLEKHLTVRDAFRLSRLEESTQAEEWGEDEALAGRAKRLETELLSAERFLRLLDAE